MAKNEKPEEQAQSMGDIQAELLRLKQELEMQLTALKAQPARTRKKPEVSKAWDERRTVFIPRGGMNEANYEIVGVNGRRYQVPKGKHVEVPLPLAERIEIKQKAEEKAYELRRKVQKESEEQMQLKRMQ